MAGRRHTAKPDEPACSAEGCERPAGFATATPGSGPCRRHGGKPAPTPNDSTLGPRVGGSPEGCEDGRELARPLPPRAVSPGEPAPDPFAALRFILGCTRRAGFNFEDAWVLAAGTVLSHREPPEARELWGVLDATRDGWCDAYAGRASRLCELTRATSSSSCRSG